MIRTIALDDEPPALRVLTHFCQQVNFIDLQKTFTRPEQARQHIEEIGVDLLFLDINMPLLSGIDFYRSMGSLQRPPLVIFTTAYAEYAVEGFNLSAVDYLLKPFTVERFEQAVNKAADQFRWQQQPDFDTNVWLYVRADYTLHKIALADILYIEGLDDYLKIYLQSGPAGKAQPIVARMTMKAMLDKLPARQFVRVHRSFIVPFVRIEGLRNKTLRVAGCEIPVGASYETDLLSRFRP